MKNKISTKIIKLTEENFNEALKIASGIINTGGIAVIPTETVYGIAASIYNSYAIQKIFEAKNRPADNPLIVHISDSKQLNDLTDEINEAAKKLMQHFWPGPLTLIFKAKEGINKKITGGLSTIAVRMPDNDFTLKLIEMTGPLAAPSANISGKPSGTEISDIFEELNGKVDLIVDEGIVRCGLESTVINTLINPPVILRKGTISKEMIEKVVEVVNFSSPGEGTISPGTKYKHYAPGIKTTYIKKITSPDHLNLLLSTISIDKKIGVIHFGLDMEGYYNNIQIENLSGNPEHASKFFYRTLRKMEKSVDEIIILPLPDHHGLWVSIEDRIERGSDKIIDVI
ncbi:MULTISPECIES: L-threonylcarbamoyladenylate synthase [Calditerrivibrio]|uniref:Threonylcarbamoyl-AMP synthase n=1 Tax=Calditerrivibrio nitroreducens TaxID=477976 RepID=A0A2J6WGJ5_9BACT|nr:MAG: threonylcarbamoyl-AMP synthase [Calditerrivibrio nitroreducens]